MFLIIDFIIAYVLKEDHSRIRPRPGFEEAAVEPSRPFSNILPWQMLSKCSNPPPH